MGEEIKNFIKVWICAVISLSYCYYVSSRIKAGVFRLLSVLPVCALFLVLPLFVSSVHFTVSTALFLSWLANFRLIIFFSFDQRPLFPLPQNLFQFICFICFPIKFYPNPYPKTILSKQLAIKVAILGVVLHMYEHKQHLYPIVLFGLYPLHLYLVLEIFLKLFNALLTLVVGYDIEPQFNEPYLATSLQEFWHPWWNLIFSEMLWLYLYAPIERMNKHVALYLSYIVPFLVSGALHELLFFYITREPPTGEVALFFVLHGVCFAAEARLYEKIRHLELKPLVSQVIVLGFVVVTADWLYFPPLVRSGKIQRLANEALFFIGFVNRKLFAFG